MKYIVGIVLVLALAVIGWKAPKYLRIYRACADIKVMADGTNYHGVMGGAVIKSADETMLAECDKILGPFF